MTQQKPDLSKISDLLNQSVQGMPKGKPSPKTPPPVDPDRPSCLGRVQSCTLRLLTLGAIVSLAAALGAIVSLALIPPQITVNVPHAIITAPPVVVTAPPIVITSTNPMTVTATPPTVLVEVTKEVPVLVTIEVVREIPVTVEVIKEVASVCPEPQKVFIPDCPPAPGQSDKSGITYENYQRLQEGMTYAEVVQILGEEGIESSNSGDYVHYRWKGIGSISIMFDDGRLASKNQSGLK